MVGRVDLLQFFSFSLYYSLPFERWPFIYVVQSTVKTIAFRCEAMDVK